MNDEVPSIANSVGFTSTRKGMSDFQKQSLRDRLLRLRLKFTWFHHGDEAHGDFEGATIAKECGYKIAVHPPTNKASVGNWVGDFMYAEADYLDRNRGIVNQSALLLAAPRNMREELRSGTWATIRYARKIYRPVTILAREAKL
jgi:hypothetical protein